MRACLSICHHPLLLVTAILFLVVACNRNAMPKTTSSLPTENMMVRMAHVSVEPEYLDQYLAILNEEAEASVRLEPGVLCIYPMFIQERPTEIRLLEIYANQEAYEAHLKTPHFQHYKTATLPMVKSLDLIEMRPISPQAMPAIFAKLSAGFRP